MLDGRASADSAMHVAIKDRDCVQAELSTTLAMLQVANGVLSATSDHLKRYSSSARAVETAVQ